MNATNPTPEQIEAARDAMMYVGAGRFGLSVVEHGMSILDAYGELARAALVAAAGAAPQEPAVGDLGELIAEAGKHSKGEPQHCDCGRPGCDGQAYCTWCGNEWPCLSRRLADALAAPPQVDEAKLAEVLVRALTYGTGLDAETNNAIAATQASDAAEYLRGGGR